MAFLPIFKLSSRQPVHNAPTWLWDPELEAYILIDENVEWTEGSGPTPLIQPPSVEEL